MTLSLAMIIKDEVQTIERTIMSVKEYVDEIVVGLDKESTDGTIDVLKKLGITPIHLDLSAELKTKGPIQGSGEWGFSKARNKVLDACSFANFRLILDGHEIVHHPENLIRIIEEAKISNCDGVEVPIHFEKDDNGIPRLIYNQGRILGPHVRYKNSMHNVPVIKQMMFSKDIVVEHCKKDQAGTSKIARDVQRSDSTIEGFEQKVKENPKDARSWFYLGAAYKENRKYHDSIRAYRKCLKHSVWNEERWHALVNTGTCFSCLGKQDKAREQFVLALGAFPPMAEAYYYLADLAYKQKQYREAQVWLDKCVELDMPSAKLCVNPKIYIVDRYDLLSMVYNHLGQFGRAIEWAKKALEAGPNLRIEKNIHIWQVHIKNHGDLYYDKIWSKKVTQSQPEITRMMRMASVLKGVTKVLDVGCGPGDIISYLSESTEYVGVDISEVARESVIYYGGRAVESLDDLGNQMFDGCILGEFLEHLEDDVGILKEIEKHLNPGAIIIASVPRYGVMRDPAHTRDYTAKEFKQLMSTIGEAEMLDPVAHWALCKTIVK